MTSLVSSLKRKLASLLHLSAANGEAHVGSGAAAAGDDGDADRRPRKRRRPNDDGDADDDARSEVSHMLRSTSWFAAPLLVRESLPAAGWGKKADVAAPAATSSGADVGGAAGSAQPSALLRLLPRDALSHCLSYLTTPSDRFSLQLTCTAFREVSDGEGMLANLELGSSAAARRAGVVDAYAPFDGEDAALPGLEAAAEGGEGAWRRGSAALALPSSTAAGGIILDGDTSVAACEKLMKFAAAGNLQAIYMIAMILCYCHENVSEGLALLRHAAESSTHLPSVYALALILRDSRSIESDYYLNVAASLGYAPAWQEKLTATEMRARFGDLDAGDLVTYLDPPCLNRLLGRHYLECKRVRKCQTSHCWNPLCGRWAYKALRAEAVRQQQQRRGGTARELIARFNARLNELAAANGNDGDGRAALNDLFEPVNASDANGGNNPHGAAASGGEGLCQPCLERPVFSIEPLLEKLSATKPTTIAAAAGDDPSAEPPSPLEQLRRALRDKPRNSGGHGLKVSRMKMCSSCRRAKYCSKLCQVYDWRSGRHKMECQFL